MATSGGVDYSDPNVSLREKWRKHVEHKRKTGIQTNAAFLNRWAPFALLFILCGCGGWGTFVAMPVLYASNDCEHWLVPGRVLAALLVVEVAVNWCLTRWVSSEYVPAVHGTRPASFPVASESDPGTSANSLLSVANGTASAGIRLVQSDEPQIGKRVNVAGDAQGNSAGSSKRDNSDAVDLDYAPPNPAKSGSYDGFSYRMLVATSLPTAEGHVERKSFPYWSWAPCLMCQRLRPPRCHHCTLCKQCVLKRDHHCYMTGTCIGVNNQRFFFAFLFWASLLTTFATVHMLPYTYYHVMTDPDYNVSILDFAPPVALIRGLLGYTSLIIFVLCLLFWGLLLFNVFSFTMLFGFVHLVVKGKTSFERENGIKVLDTRSLGGKLHSVFGDCWWLSLLVPTYPWVRHTEDAILWPHIKPC